MSRETRVGALLIAALAALAAGILLVGERSRLFTRKNDYTIRFRTVGGLNAGSPVQLNGVAVGRVEEVVLPERVAVQELTVRISIDRRYAQRVRSDSTGRIKTLGLLGDKYVEISSGSPGSPLIPSGGEIAAAPLTDVDEILASGGDVVENIVAVSISLRTILSKMERGEGLLGLLTVDTPTGVTTKESLVSTLAAADHIARRLDRGEGTLGRLLTHDQLGRDLESATGRLAAVLDRFESGTGLLPVLLDDAATRERATTALTRLDRLLADLEAFAERLRAADGTLARLAFDEAYGRRFTGELERLVATLNDIAAKLNTGEGTAARLLNDPAVYEAVDDILVGVEESRLLRWLVRNRQRAGIDRRYEEARGAGGAPPEDPEEERHKEKRHP